MSVLPKHSTPAVPNDFLFLDANGNITRIGLDDLKSLVKELPTFPTTAGNYHLKAVVDSEGATTLSWVTIA